MIISLYQDLLILFGFILERFLHHVLKLLI